MKPHACLLILLLISAQADDAWVDAPVLSSTSLADENDEYLPAPRPPHVEQPSSRQQPVFDGVKYQTADFSLVPRAVSSEQNLTIPFAPRPFYLLMSLQI
jgi:hypothetical protein